MRERDDLVFTMAEYRGRLDRLRDALAARELDATAGYDAREPVLSHRLPDAWILLVPGPGGAGQRRALHGDAAARGLQRAEPHLAQRIASLPGQRAAAGRARPNHATDGSRPGADRLRAAQLLLPGHASRTPCSRPCPRPASRTPMAWSRPCDW